MAEESFSATGGEIFPLYQPTRGRMKQKTIKPTQKRKFVHGTALCLVKDRPIPTRTLMNKEFFIYNSRHEVERFRGNYQEPIVPDPICRGYQNSSRPDVCR